jgi:hypothetical protein
LLAEEGIELARELPADVLHLALCNGLFQDAHKGSGVSLSLIHTYPLTLANLLEKIF